MRAAVLHRFGEPLTEAEVELAEPAADEVLVRVTDSGICHSDRTVHSAARTGRCRSSWATRPPEWSSGWGPG